MKRYFFDLRDGDELTPDDEGLELSTMEAVQRPRVRWQTWRGTRPVGPHNGAGHRMAIEVRDDTGPVLQAKFTFQIERLKH